MSSFLLYDPFQEFERFFDESFNDRVNRPAINDRSGQALQRRSNVGTLQPRMDLHENKEANTVTATFELPGITKDNVDISVQNGRLVISGESKISSEHEENGYAVRERKFGKFSRMIQLPQGVKDDQITASLENGVLTVTFPKTTPETEPKRIAIA